MHKDNPLATLEEVLQDSFKAIQLGDYARLDQFAIAAEEGIANLNDISDAAALDHLRGLAERNAACLQAAARGMRAARRRLAEIAAAEAGFHSYDGKGQPLRIGGRGAKVTQRY